MRFALSPAAIFTDRFVRTSGENIGDTGLIQAFRAWKVQYKASEADGNEYILTGLD